MSNLRTLLFTGLVLLLSANLTSQNFTQFNNWKTRLTSDHPQQVRLEFLDADSTIHGAISGQSNGVNFGLIDGDNQWSLLAQKDQFTQFRINNKIRMRIGKETANTTLLSLGDFNNASGNSMTIDVAAGHGHSNILTGAYLNGTGKHKFIGTRKASRIAMGDGGFQFMTSTGSPVRNTEIQWRTSLEILDNGWVKLPNRVLQLADQTFWGDNVSQFYLRSNNINNSRLVLFSNDNAGSNNPPVNVNLGALFGNRNANGQKTVGILDGDGNWSYQAVQDVATIFRINNVERMRIRDNGRVGIGTNAPSRRLHVNGDARINTELYIGTNSKGNLPGSYRVFVDGAIAAEEVRCQLSQNWGDYVFAPEYQLMPLTEVKAFVAQNSHLPNIPKAKELEINGLEMADMITRQMVKIEELTLYAIEQDEKIEALKVEKQALEDRLNAIEQVLRNIQSSINQN